MSSGVSANVTIRDKSNVRGPVLQATAHGVAIGKRFTQSSKVLSRA